MKLLEEELYKLCLKRNELIHQLDKLRKSLKMRKNYQLSHKLSVLNMREEAYDFLVCSSAKQKNRSVWSIGHNQDIKLKEKLLFNAKSTPVRDRFFMIDLADCVRNWAVPNIQVDDFQSIKYEEKFVKNLAFDFFESLTDKELAQYASIFTKEYNAGYAVAHLKEKENVYYKFYPDYFMGHSLYLIQGTNTILDYFFTNHQIMECVSLGMHAKEPWNHHHGLENVPANTMDYLFIDYLQDRFSENPYLLEEIEKLKIWKSTQVTEKADLFLEYQKSIEQEIASEDFSFERIYENICALNHAFTCVLSEVLGYAIYDKWKKDSKQGLELLKTYIHADFPLDEEPDFSFLGLSDENLKEYALQLRNFSWKPEFMMKKSKENVKRWKK